MSSRSSDGARAGVAEQVIEVGLRREINDAMSLLRRLSTDAHSDPDEIREVSTTLDGLQRRLAGLREEMS